MHSHIAIILEHSLLQVMALIH